MASRIGATVVGLLVGLAAVALPVRGALLDGATVAVALVILLAASFDAGVRLGAASTLIVTSIPGHQEVTNALERGANVILGCAIAVLLGLVFFPQRAAERLRAALKADADEACNLVRSSLLAYLDGTELEHLRGDPGELALGAKARASALADAAREPTERGARLLSLKRRVVAVDTLGDSIGALVTAVGQAANDTAQSLVEPELRDVAEAFAAIDGAPAAAALLRLRQALSALDAAFSAVRARRATVHYPTDELARLFSIIRSLQSATEALSDLRTDDRTYMDLAPQT